MEGEQNFTGFSCIVRDSGLRVWAKAMASLASFGGSDIHFLFSRESLSLTTYDASVTCHVTLVFSASFFGEYDLGDGIESLECKVPVKCALKPFRSSRFMSKCAKECRMKFAKGADALTVTMFTKAGVEIGYQLRLLFDSELLEIDFDVGLLTNKMTGSPKFLLSMLENFHFYHAKGAGDLTMKVFDDHVSWRNSVTDLIKKEGKLYTELNLSEVDFLEYVVVEECQLTFPLRDFRTFLAFADTLDLPVTIQFLNGSQPLVVNTVTTDNMVTTKLMLANRTNPLSVAQEMGANQASTSSITGTQSAPSVCERQRGTQGSVSLLDQPESPVYPGGENMEVDVRIPVVDHPVGANQGLVTVPAAQSVAPVQSGESIVLVHVPPSTPGVAVAEPFLELRLPASPGPRDYRSLRRTAQSLLRGSAQKRMPTTFFTFPNSMRIAPSTPRKREYPGPYFRGHFDTQLEEEED